MNTRPLSVAEEGNLQIVRGSVGDFALLFVTATGLEKGILDATLPIRTLLKENGIHDFNTQGQGSEHKVVLNGVVVEDGRLVPIRFSLYRPETKQGDPRMWPYGFTEYARADDAFIIFITNGIVHFSNLTRSGLHDDFSRRLDVAASNLTHSDFSENIANSRGTVATEFFAALDEKASIVSKELLQNLRQIASRGPIPSACRGDTSIGRSIELALGIGMNAKQAPDYKGIELKSYRSTKTENGLITLFSKTPDWDRSALKGSNDYLTRFGYERNGLLKLYCSVHATKANAQGLRLNLNFSANDLEEFHLDNRDEILAVWSMDTLHGAFRQKHNETFWITADTVIQGGEEYFKLRSVTHTRKPVMPQFDSFILDGEICLDHTIKRKGVGAKDHGYLFRVRQEKFTELFTGAPKNYALS